MISTALLIFFTAFIVSCIAMPNIIKISVKKLLFDAPTEERKIHKKNISNLGGIGIFIGFFFSILLFRIICDSLELSSLAAAAVLLFFVALKDDLIPSSPLSRLFYQVLIASIIVFIGQVHFNHIPIFEAGTAMRRFVNILFSLFFVVGVINAMNFIDGIDGLAASLSVFLSLIFGYIFYQYGQLDYSYTSLALGGAVLGFLIFNFAPARIFMGDIGSMLIGVFLAIFGIKLANMDTLPLGLLQISYPGTIMYALLIVPIMDLITVVGIRLYLKKSPFQADKRHLHHRLLVLGLSHPAICFSLLFFNILVLATAFLLQKTDSSLWTALAVTLLAITCELLVLWFYSKKKKLDDKELDITNHK